MKEKMAKMESDKEVYLAENADMKQRFAEQEAQQKEMAVDAFMKEMAEKSADLGKQKDGKSYKGAADDDAPDANALAYIFDKLLIEIETKMKK